MTSRSLLATLALPLLFLAPGALDAGLKDFSSSSQSRGFKNETGSKLFSKEVSETADRVSFRVKLKVREGAVAWRLEDPHGRVRAEGRAEAGEAREWKDWFNPKDGEWRLVLRFYAASGRYGVKLATR